MQKFSMFLGFVAIAASGVALPAAAAPTAAPSVAPSVASAFWGQLNQRVGKWGKMQVMRRGFLGNLVQRGAKHHPAFAKMLAETLKSHNAALGKCSGRWPNFRMALANVAAATARGAGVSLASPMKAFSQAAAGGCALVGKGGQANVIKALQGAIAELRGKAKPQFLNGLRTAISWMKKPNLWAGKP